MIYTEFMPFWMRMQAPSLLQSVQQREDCPVSAGAGRLPLSQGSPQGPKFRDRASTVYIYVHLLLYLDPSPFIIIKINVHLMIKKNKKSFIIIDLHWKPNGKSE